MARESKRARYESLLAARVMGVSDSAFSAVLAKVAAHPDVLDIYNNGRKFREELQKPVEKQFQETAVCLKLPLKGGGDMSWEVMDLGLLLRLFVSKCPAYKQLLETTMQQHGSKLSLLIVRDEIAAGAC